MELRGARDVASQALAFSQPGLHVEPALINGTPGIISSRDGQPFSVIGFTVTAARSPRSTSSSIRLASGNSI